MNDYVELITRTKIKGTKDYYVIKVDKDDYDWISQLAIYVRNEKYKYVYYKEIYKDKTISSKTSYLARTILGINNNENHDFVAQYKNGDFLDLRKDNLKLITRIELKLGKEVNNRELPTGVYRHGNKYVASIRILNNLKYLGLYDSPKEAHKAYLKAYNKLKEAFKEK